MAEQKRKYMSVKTFREFGFLHEVNRLFLHPLGLAIEVAIDDKTEVERFGAVWDYRDDPEGMLFADDTLNVEKIDRVRAFADEKHAERLKLLGYVVQPKPGREVTGPQFPLGTDWGKKIAEAKDPIVDFRGPYRFLSNFHMAPVDWMGEQYPSTEHAYQAAKTLDPAKQKWIREMGNCYQAKKAGNTVDLRPDWENIKVWVMTTLVREKFLRHWDLREMLLATKDTLLVEGNTWGDTFWGVCEGKGRNELGKILMDVRDDLKAVA